MGVGFGGGVGTGVAVAIAVRVKILFCHQISTKFCLRRRAVEIVRLRELASRAVVEVARESADSTDSRGNEGSGSVTCARR